MALEFLARTIPEGPTPAPVYHEPAPYHPPAPAYHEPAPYHPPKPHHDPYHKEHHDPYHNEHGVPGIPCKDYPCLAEAPYTKFSCASVPFRPGMYADPESGCQAYRVCNDGRDGPSGAGFVCPNGTLFDQYQFACEFWHKVDCSKAVSLYELNADPYKNPYYPKPKLDEYGKPIPVHVDPHHGPVHHVAHHAAPIHHAAPVHPVAPIHHAAPVHHLAPAPHPAPVHHPAPFHHPLPAPVHPVDPFIPPHTPVVHVAAAPVAALDHGIKPFIHHGK